MSHLPATPPPERLEQAARRVRAVMGQAAQAHHVAHGELTLHTEAAALLALMRFLRDDEELQFRQLIDICGVDYPSRPRRFDVVYHLLSLHQNMRVRVKLETDEVNPVPSLTAEFPNADWYEREAFDLYGVQFAGHPDLRRLLTDYNFTGHPMRKDFPTTGYVELRYDTEQGQVVYEPVKLDQQYRKFDFLSPWEGIPRELPGDEKAQKGGPIGG
jgi:NADH-quinone oxidoreductase subunit C